MILRNRNINTTADEVRLHVAYGGPDVRRFARILVRLFGGISSSPHGVFVEDSPRKVSADDELEAIYYLRHNKFSEEDVRYSLERHPLIFQNYETKWREQLSRWAFVQLLKLGYLTPTATDENVFQFSRSALRLVFSDERLNTPYAPARDGERYFSENNG